MRDEKGIYGENITPVNATVFGNSIDHKESGYVLGGSQRPRSLGVIVKATFTVATSVQIVMKVSDASGFSPAVDHPISGVIPIAELTAGVVLEYPLSAQIAGRYSEIVPVVAGTAETTGKLDIFLIF